MSPRAIYREVTGEGSLTSLVPATPYQPGTTWRENLGRRSSVGEYELAPARNTSLPNAVDGSELDCAALCAGTSQTASSNAIDTRPITSQLSEIQLSWLLSLSAQKRRGSSQDYPF